MTRAVLVAGTVLMGLSAGLFVTFSIAVMPGLRRAGDAAFVEAMRGMNVAILNPVFGVIFGGAFVVTAAALVMGWGDASRPWVIASLVLYALGAFILTGAVNVPMNEALEAGKGSASSLRETFEDKWILWNHARSVLTASALVALVIGVLKA